MPAPTEIQKQNKTLQQILDVLKAGQTPAAVKRQADAERKVTEQQAYVNRKRAEREAKKAAEDEKDKKEKKTTQEQTLSLFQIMKNDVTAWALKTGENQITWGNLGKVLKESVKTWFKKVSETNTMLGRTFRFGAALWNNVFKKIGQNFSKLFSAVTGQIREVLGPVAALYDLMMSTLKGIWDTTKSVLGSFWTFFFKKVPPADKRRNKLLRGMLHEMIRARKGKFTEGLGDKKGSMMGRLLGKAGIWMLFLAKVLLIGYAVYKFISGILGSNEDSWVDRVKDGFKSIIGFFTQFLPESVQEWINTAIDFLVDFNPIRPLISFFQGFFEEDGTFWQKIKAGFNRVVIDTLKIVAKWGPIMAKAISPLIEGIVSFFKGFWNSAVNWILGMLKNVPFTEGMRKWLAGTTFNLATAGAGAAISDEEARRWQGMAGNAALANAPLNEIKDLMAEANARYAMGQEDSVNALVQLARESGGYKTEVNVDKDEVDNRTITFGNADMEFGSP